MAHAGLFKMKLTPYMILSLEVCERTPIAGIST